jgi:hypothetical protein
MYRNHRLLSLLTAALLAAPAAYAGAQQDTTKPITPKTVGTSVERESKRAANRTGDVAQKAGKQTEAQAKRTANGVKKVYSRKARREARGDTVTTYTSNGTSTPLTLKTAPTATGKAIEKAGKQTEAQAKRAAKDVKKVYSRKARREARGDSTN